jgi:hypothetical protein
MPAESVRHPLPGDVVAALILAAGVFVTPSP